MSNDKGIEELTNLFRSKSRVRESGNLNERTKLVRAEIEGSFTRDMLLEQRGQFTTALICS